MIDLDTQKKISEIEKLNAEKWKTVGGLAVGAASTVGLVTIFIYCFFVAHFFPTGLKIGDTLFFIFAMLGLSLTGIVLSGFGMMAYVPWTNRLPEPSLSAGSTASKKISDVLLIGLPLCILGLVLCVRALSLHLFASADAAPMSISWASVGISLTVLAYVATTCFLCRSIGTALVSIAPGLMFAIVTGLLSVLFPTTWSALVFTAGLLLGGLSVALGLDLLNLPVPETTEDFEKNRRKKRVAGTLLIIGVIIPYLACGIDGKILNYVMSSLGVYTEHATLIVNKAEFGKLQTVADAKGIRLYSCRMDDESAAVSDVRIWWHGAGERSYVEVGAYNPTEKNTPVENSGVRVELDSAGVRKSESRMNTSCIELRRGIYFESNKSKLTPDQWKLAEPIVNEFFKVKTENDSIVVVGYADPRPSNTESNFKLAHDRACDVYNHLAAARLNAKNNVLIDIRGDMDGMSVCSSKDGVARERACEERNRRVELRLIGSGGKEVVRSAAANATEVCR